MMWIFLWINIFLFALYMAVLTVFGILFMQFRALYMENHLEELKEENTRNSHSSARNIRAIVWILCIAFFINAVIISVLKPVAFFYYEQVRNFNYKTAVEL